MLGYMRNRKRIVQGESVAQHRPRTIPEHIYMWGGSFWDAWKKQSSPLAQQHLDQLVAQFKRSTRMTELRFYRSGSVLTIQAGGRSLRVEMLWENGQVVDVVDLGRSERSAKNAYRTTQSSV